jgi:ElaB/YqjD/DUF883 family membrane-anchored ribosome-binding protein
MTDTDLKPAAKEAKKASASAHAALEHAERSFGEAKVSLADAAKRVEQSVLEGFDTLRAQTRTYSDTAGHQLEEAQRYVSERVKERPITATLAGLGVGVLLGLLLAGGSRNHNK